ncbi:dual specificity protein phosphatase 16-like isoform X2 [Watersipora subatra]
MTTPEVAIPSAVTLPWWADLIDADEMADLIRNQCDEKVLLIDCRSFIEFNQSNVVNSINVCCNKIVKRRLQQNKLKIEEFLSSTCHIEIDDGYMIILYDNTTTDASCLPDDNIVTILGSKCSKAFSRVRVLYGGFLEFQSHHPSLLETKAKTVHQQATASLSQPCLPVTNIGPTKILPYLFLGSMKDALNADLAQANGITYVLNVSMTCPKPAHIQDGHFLRIPVNDNYSEKLLPYFHDAFQFIDKVKESGGCVLVHCLAGVSRSPTLAIAYIMRCYNMVSEEAYRYVKEKRVAISPNFNFLGQLLEYEKQIEKEDSSNFTGSKRRCIDDLRAELSTPSSPIATPKIPKSMCMDSTGVKISQAQSPTSALAKLRFDHCHSANQNLPSPTTALAKLRFGGIELGSTRTPSSPAPEEDFMRCYSADTIHQNTSATNSPSGSTPVKAPSSLHILNTNSSNSNLNTDSSRSPSPSSARLSRPACLTLQNETPGLNPAESQSVTSPESTKFKEPERLDSGVVLRDQKDSDRRQGIRPRSVTMSGLAVSPSMTEHDSLTASPSSIDTLLESVSQGRSRSLENILQVVDNVAATPSAGNIGSTGSHSSLHGSLEVITVL